MCIHKYIQHTILEDISHCCGDGPTDHRRHGQQFRGRFRTNRLQLSARKTTTCARLPITSSAAEYRTRITIGISAIAAARSVAVASGFRRHRRRHTSAVADLDVGTAFAVRWWFPAVTIRSTHILLWWTGHKLRSCIEWRWCCTAIRSSTNVPVRCSTTSITATTTGG